MLSLKVNENSSGPYDPESMLGVTTVSPDQTLQEH